MSHKSNKSGQDERTGIVLLAAGASSRMGTPKQLLKINGVSLIRHASTQALESGCRPVVIVLGANANLIAPELNALEIRIAVNRDWKAGMSSSIRSGMEALLGIDSRIESVILFLADQPNVTGTSLARLASAHVQTGRALVAASYSGSIGTPALFSRCYFDELLQLEGQGGAKSLLARYAHRVLPIDFPEAACDLDTPKDLAVFASPSLEVRSEYGN
jgi:molybdenum cofactor cytidylyltransferase